METLAEGAITVEAGLTGDSRGAKFKTRQITVLAREDWEAALLDVGSVSPAEQRQAGSPAEQRQAGSSAEQRNPKERPLDLPWTVRRANLLVESVRLPRAKGGILRIGAVVLEITGQTNPCHRMEEAQRGLLSALHPEWRGGVTCRVLKGGSVRTGDAVEVLVAPNEHTMRLPD